MRPTVGIRLRDFSHQPTQGDFSALQMRCIGGLMVPLSSAHSIRCGSPHWCDVMLAQKVRPLPQFLCDVLGPMMHMIPDYQVQLPKMWSNFPLCGNSLCEACYISILILRMLCILILLTYHVEWVIGLVLQMTSP